MVQDLAVPAPRFRANGLSRETQGEEAGIHLGPFRCQAFVRGLQMKVLVIHQPRWPFVFVTGFAKRDHIPQNIHFLYTRL